MKAEDFRPVSNTPPENISGFLKFYGRMVLDLQICTIYRDVKKTIPAFEGKVLDIGCGQSPYRFLLNRNKTSYSGIDIADAASFDYDNKDITPFNGRDIPFEDGIFDAFICTEVMEHVEDYERLTSEILRVCRKGAKGIITIPWSARYHYIPYDYFRYTPSTLKKMYSAFNKVIILNRGTDVTSIASKIIVLYFRNLLPKKFINGCLCQSGYYCRHY